MKRHYTIERLPRPEHCGDWHDKPVKWIVKFDEIIFTQKFCTKKDAIRWGRLASKAETFSEAFQKWN